MKHFLRDGDEVIADNVKLVYRNSKFVIPEDGLDHCLKYVFHVPTELECELMFETAKEGVLSRPRPYYDEPCVE